MDAITIRRGIEADFGTVLGLIKEFSEFQGTPEKVVNTVQQMVQEKELFNCFVAEKADGEIVGFVTFFFCYYSWSGKAIYMDDLYVKIPDRGRGVGTKLLKAVYKHGQNNRCYKLRWQVSKWNKAAIGFYKSLGASIDEVEINCDILIV